MEITNQMVDSASKVAPELSKEFIKEILDAGLNPEVRQLTPEELKYALRFAKYGEDDEFGEDDDFPIPVLHRMKCWLNSMKRKIMGRCGSKSA